MNKAGVKHLPKSPMAYAYKTDVLHLYLQTAKDDVEEVELIIGDPFDYECMDGKYTWKPQISSFLKMKKAYSTENHDFWFQEVKTLTRRVKYGFILHSQKSKYFYGCRKLKEFTDEPKWLFEPSQYFNFPYILEADIISTPSWCANTIWYQIFPDRFCRVGPEVKEYRPWNAEHTQYGHEFYGGNLQGIISKIPYLQNLGITGIYLTPIFEAYSVHKYDTIDYYRIDSHLGTKEDLKHLVQSCHQAGIKIILDAVFNHCGWFHPFFQDVIKNKSASPYWNCFFIDNEDFIDFPIDSSGLPEIPNNYRPKFRTFANTVMMPKLNTNNPFMEDYLLNVAKYWTREFDIDGWRLDVSNEISHQFWRKFRNEIKKIKDDIYIVGENWDDANPWLQGDQFDAVMNYELSYPLWEFFGSDQDEKIISAKDFQIAINNLLVRYPKNVAINMYNLLDSHDTMRFFYRVKGNKKLFTLAYVFLFAFAGSPALFYGDESGLLGGREPDCRCCMNWENQDLELFNFFQRIIRIRKSNPDFQVVDINWIMADDGTLVFKKRNTLIIINNSPNDKTIPLENNYTDLESGVKYSQEILVHAYGYLLLKEC